MLHKTKGIVLRSVKYGETSIVTTIFTADFGIQPFMVKGVRSQKARLNRAGSFQPGTLLDLVVYNQPQKNLQHLNQYQFAYLYTSIQEEVIKNSIVLFSAELLLRLLPEQAPLPSLFEVVYSYFIKLDTMPISAVSNFPLYFIIQCCKELGFEIRGGFTKETPYLNMEDGEFSDSPPSSSGSISEEDARQLETLLRTDDIDELKNISLNGPTRLRLIDWFIAYLKLHTQHMGNIRSLAVLQAILH